MALGQSPAAERHPCPAIRHTRAELLGHIPSSSDRVRADGYGCLLGPLVGLPGLLVGLHAGARRLMNLLTQRDSTLMQFDHYLPVDSILSPFGIAQIRSCGPKLD